MLPSGAASTAVTKSLESPSAVETCKTCGSRSRSSPLAVATQRSCSRSSTSAPYVVAREPVRPHESLQLPAGISVSVPDPWCRSTRRHRDRPSRISARGARLPAPWRSDFRLVSETGSALWPEGFSIKRSAALAPAIDKMSTRGNTVHSAGCPGDHRHRSRSVEIQRLELLSSKILRMRCCGNPSLTAIDVKRTVGKQYAYFRLN